MSYTPIPIDREALTIMDVPFPSLEAWKALHLPSVQICSRTTSQPYRALRSSATILPEKSVLIHSSVRYRINDISNNNGYNCSYYIYNK